MTSDLAVRAALTSALSAIDGLHLYRWVPGSVNTPAAIVTRRITNFDSTMQRGSDGFEYVVTVMCQWSDPEVAQRTMSAFLDTSGASSIKAVVEDDVTLGGVVDFARVREAGQEEIRQVNESSYLAVDFIVEVTA